MTRLKDVIVHASNAQVSDKTHEYAATHHCGTSWLIACASNQMTRISAAEHARKDSGHWRGAQVI